jgi:DNA-binding transcriptional LysR family regulator
MLDLRRLEILRHFAALGTITATAAELGYSASAISQQLATLEREAGVALVERAAQSAILTPAGRELTAHAVLILAAVEAAQSAMREQAGIVAGRIDVSCIPGLAGDLAPHLAALQRAHSELSITARETESATAALAVLEGRSDLAIVDEWGEPTGGASGLTVHQLRREPIVLGLPLDHPQAGRSGPISATTLRDLIAGDTWLSTPAGQLSRIAGDARLAELGIVPTRRWEFEGQHVLAAVIAAGAGLALLPAQVVSEQPGVVGRPLQPRMYRRVIALTRTSRERDPTLVACLAAARAAIGRPPGPAIGSSPSPARA